MKPPPSHIVLSNKSSSDLALAMSQSEGAKLQTQGGWSLQCEMPHAIPNAHIEFLISILLALPTWLSMQWHLAQFIFATSTWPISLAIVHDSPESGHLPKWSQSSLHLHLQLVILRLEPPAMGWEWLWSWTPEITVPFGEPGFRWCKLQGPSVFNHRTVALKRIGCSRRGGGPNLATTNGKGKWLEEGATLIHLHDHGHSILTYYDSGHIHTIPNTGLQYMIQYAAKRSASLDYWIPMIIETFLLSATQWCLWDRRPWPD